MKRVLVVSHADADGHVIAEQVRRNLEAVPSFRVTTVVDPVRTKDHRTWTKLDAITEIEVSEIVFFVDLMFAPSDFATEADALVQFVSARPTKQFFLLDHHPLPLRLLSRARNLRPVYRPDVVDCTLGPPTWMMIIAALLEKQETRARKIKKPVHDVLAKGMQRAAAPGGPLVGEKLMALLHFDRWAEIEELGRDDAAKHPLPRGRRPSDAPISKVLAKLDQLASDLILSLKNPTRGPGKSQPPARSPMSYDLEVAEQGIRAPAITPAGPRDLEAIVMLLELGAIYLTQGPDSTFTTEELLAEARRIGGDEIVLDEKDVRIVLGKAGFLRKESGRLRLK
jgi:hypothetical protein